MMATELIPSLVVGKCEPLQRGTFRLEPRAIARLTRGDDLAESGLRAIRANRLAG
jgi:hypothetical protein